MLSQETDQTSNRSHRTGALLKDCDIPPHDLRIGVFDFGVVVLLKVALTELDEWFAHAFPRSRLSRSTIST